MSEAEILCGVAGWSYPDWKGIVYPSHSSRGFHPLAYLSRYLDLVEVNSTFYQPGSAKAAASWVEKVRDNKRFRFTVKLWRRFTHETDDWSAKEAEQAKAAPRVFQEADRLSAVLIQFPWSFRNTERNRARLLRVTDLFSDFPLAVELRHGSWEDEKFRELLKERGICLASVDQPLIGKSLRPSDLLTAGFGYVRLHGRNYENWFKEDAGRDARYDYLYSEKELKPWAERIKRMATAADRVLVVANNHYRGQAVANALQLKRMLGLEARSPSRLAASFPFLKDMEEEPEGELFPGGT